MSETMTESLLRTPLYDAHVAFGGRIVPFAGWELPVQFAGIIAEHHHTRTACTVFDVSHMGRLKLTGRDCESLLNSLSTRNLADADVDRSYYTHLCKEDGGILDDVIVTRFESHWGIVCNGANREKIVQWIQRHAAARDVTLKDQTLETAMIAIQGPKTLEVAQGLIGSDLSTIKRYRCRVFNIFGMSITVYRSGYTGEDGFEVVLPAGLTKMLLPKILGTADQPHAIVKPAGLGARDTLRIEAGMPLYGHELSEEIDSLTAGQSWCVDLSKEFIGRDALAKRKDQGLERRLIGLELEGRRIARTGASVYSSNTVIGEVTSGTLSPTLGKSIAMAFVRFEHGAEGGSLEVAVGSKRASATIVKLPFYKRKK